MDISKLSGEDFNVMKMLHEHDGDLSNYSAMDDTDINDDAFDIDKLTSPKEVKALQLVRDKLGITDAQLQTYDMDTVAGLMAIARAMDAVEKGTASDGTELDAQKDLLKYADNFLGKLYGADPTIMPVIDAYKTWVDENKNKFDENIHSELTDGLDVVFKTKPNTAINDDTDGITLERTDDNAPSAVSSGTTAVGATDTKIIPATVTPTPSTGDADFASKSMKGEAITADSTDSVAGDLSNKLLVYTGTQDDRENAELLLNKIIEMYNNDDDFKEQLDKVITEKGSVNFTVADLKTNTYGQALVGEKGGTYENEILINMDKHKTGGKLDDANLQDTIAHELLHNMGYDHGDSQDAEIKTLTDGQ